MISVIVPVYNVEKYLKRCVDSILEQSYRDFELILVDDGSTDESGTICDKLKERDERIRVIHQKNGGLSAARNRGLAEATGDYFTLIDSDDFIDKSFLETLYENAEKYKADVSVCGYRLVWEDPGKNKKKQDCERDEVKLYTGKEAVHEIVSKSRTCMITAWGKLYHHSLREHLFYPEGKLHEDEYVTYKVFYASTKVVETEKDNYCYFQRSSSIMNGYNIKRLDKIEALKEAVEFFEERNEEELALRARKRYVINIQIAWYRVNVFMPERKEILGELKKKWQEVYQENRAEIRSICSFIDKVAIGVFVFSPRLFGWIAQMLDCMGIQL